MRKNVLLVGGTGQFGITLAKKISSKKNIIITTRNINEANKRFGKIKNIVLKKINILDKKQILKLLIRYKPSIVFYLAGQSSPKISFSKKQETLQSNFTGCKFFLEVIHSNRINTKFLNASSSEIFKPSQNKLGLNSKKKPISPYGLAKLESYKITKFYREVNNLNAFNAIIFNTESKYRNMNYLIPKICLAAIKAKKYNIKTSFGDLDVVREWNWCDEQCKYMLKFLNKEPQDFILSNNKPISAKKMLNFAFNYFKLNYKNFIYFDKANLRKKDFKLRLSDNKKIFKKNNISFNYKIYGKKIIEKLIKYYLKKNFLK